MTLFANNSQANLKPIIAVLSLLLFLSLSGNSWAHNPPLPASGECPTDHSPVGNRCSHNEELVAPPGGVAANPALGTVTFPTGFNMDASSVLNSLVGIFIAVGGLVFFFMLLFGGIRFMTAGGDPKNAESARKTITNAIIGLLIVVGAYLVTSVLGDLLGIPFLRPNIPGL